MRRSKFVRIRISQITILQRSNLDSCDLNILLVAAETIRDGKAFHGLTILQEKNDFCWLVWQGVGLMIFYGDVHVMIHSGHFYSAPSSPLLLRGAPDYSTETVSEFHAEAHRQL